MDRRLRFLVGTTEKIATHYEHNPNRIQGFAGKIRRFSAVKGASADAVKIAANAKLGKPKAVRRIARSTLKLATESRAS